MQNKMNNSRGENFKSHIPKSLDFKQILGFFKKLLWLVLVIFIAFNITLFYFLDGIIYFLAIIIGNVLLFWVQVPIMIWIGRTFLIEKGLEVAEEVKENFTKIGNEKIVRVVKKEEDNK